MLATSVVALFLFALLPSVYAFGGFGPREGGKNFNPENREAIETAIEAEDYEAFVEATGNEDLSEEKFAEMLERHAEIETRRAENEAEREAIRNAIASGDFETWKNLISAKNENAQILEKITAENFSQLQEMYELREEMREIQDGLGTRFDFGVGGGMNECGGFSGKHGGPRGFQH